MGRTPRKEYLQTIRNTEDGILYTQAALADLAIRLGFISKMERKIAKTAFRRFALNIEPDDFIPIPGHGGKYPAWYGKTLKKALK